MSLDPKASDKTLMEFALREGRILVTEDKDFGELIFVQRLPHGPIVRTVELATNEKSWAMGELLERHAADLDGAVVITLTRGRIRIRRVS